MFGCASIKNSLILQSEHNARVRKAAETLRKKDGATISATAYLSEVARSQTERVRQEKERNLEKEKNRRLAEVDGAMHERTKTLSKQRYCYRDSHIQT